MDVRAASTARHEDAIALMMVVATFHLYLQFTYHTMGLAHETLARQSKASLFCFVAMHTSIC